MTGSFVTPRQVSVRTATWPLPTTLMANRSAWRSLLVRHGDRKRRIRSVGRAVTQPGVPASPQPSIRRCLLHAQHMRRLQSVRVHPCESFE